MCVCICCFICQSDTGAFSTAGSSAGSVVVRSHCQQREIHLAGLTGPDTNELASDKTSHAWCHYIVIAFICYYLLTANVSIYVDRHTKQTLCLAFSCIRICGMEVNV